MDFNNYLFHPSSLGDIMTEAKGVGLSETTKTHLKGIFFEEVFKRRKEIVNKFLIKGVNVEGSSIELLNKIYGTKFEKNEKVLKNEFLEGTPDIRAYQKKVRDIKSRWDMFTFINTIDKPMDKDNSWQLRGYMMLEDCDGGEIVNTLINTPLVLIQDELRREQYEWVDGTPNWREIEIIKNHTFDFPTFSKYVTMICPPQDKWADEMFDSFEEMPAKFRIHVTSIQRDKTLEEKLIERIKECRNWLNEFSKRYEK